MLFFDKMDKVATIQSLLFVSVSQKKCFFNVIFMEI